MNTSILQPLFPVGADAHALTQTVPPLLEFFAFLHARQIARLPFLPHGGQGKRFLPALPVSGFARKSGLSAQRGGFQRAERFNVAELPR